MDAFRHLSRVTTRVCELGLFLRYLWYEIQVTTGLFYLEVPEYLGLSGCDSRPLGESSIFGLHGDKVHSVKFIAYIPPGITCAVLYHTDK